MSGLIGVCAQLGSAGLCKQCHRGLALSYFSRCGDEEEALTRAPRAKCHQEVNSPGLGGSPLNLELSRSQGLQEGDYREAW